MASTVNCTAFRGARRIASGSLSDVALELHSISRNGDPILIFDDETSALVELDLRGELEVVRRR